MSAAPTLAHSLAHSLARSTAAVGLAGASALHVRWTKQTIDGTLPDDFAEVWIGDGARVPPAWMTAGVAGVLAAMTGSVAANHRSARLVGGILAARAAGGFVASGLSSSDGPFRARDLALYSPFCATLATLIWLGSRR
ncbi:MAG: hypothetical protein ACRBI6_07385 [Acidimicrobiales bacterium]